MKLVVVYDSAGNIMAAAPTFDEERKGITGSLRPVPAQGERDGEFEVEEAFSDPEYMARRCRALIVDTTGPEPRLRAKP